MKRFCIWAAALFLLAALNPFAASASLAGTIKTSAANIKHVFVIVLENKNYSDTFGTSTQDPYLQKTLVPMGGLLTQYYGTGHVSLDNYISMVSGQPSAPDTQTDCANGFKDIQQTGTTVDGLLIGTTGCIYPASVKTIVPSGGGGPGTLPARLPLT